MFDFFLIGGDERLSYMTNLLIKKNFRILTYSVDARFLDKKIYKTNSLKYAISNSKNIICPIPFTRDFVFLHSKNKKIYIKEFLKYVSCENNIFGGCIPCEILDWGKNKNIFIYDYMKNKKFVVYNSISTAEAAVAYAILKNPVNMHFSRCLVLGFGNCGRLICSKLKNLCSDIFVCTNDDMQKTWANAYGFYTFSLDILDENVNSFNYIFNTIPEKIFYGNILDKLNKDVFILDITKDGVDREKCIEKSINFEYIPGIPGRFKAISSANILTDITLKVINKI